MAHIQHRPGTVERIIGPAEAEARWLRRYGAVMIHDLQTQITALQLQVEPETPRPPSRTGALLARLARFARD